MYNLCILSIIQRSKSVLVFMLSTLYLCLVYDVIIEFVLFVIGGKSINASQGFLLRAIAKPVRSIIQTHQAFTTPLVNKLLHLQIRSGELKIDFSKIEFILSIKWSDLSLEISLICKHGLRTREVIW